MIGINSNILLVMFVAIATIGLIGTLSTQFAHAQESDPVQDLKDLIASITGIVTALAGLAGAIIVVYAKLSKKLGLATDSEIKKLLELASELKKTDEWGKQLDERTIQIVDLIASTSEGKKAIEDKHLELTKWKKEFSDLDTELGDIHKKLDALIKTK